MKHEGSCHCKSVEFEIESDLSFNRQCNCTICIRKNAKMVIISKEDFLLLKGSGSLSLYQFNKNIAKHYFCKKCFLNDINSRNSEYEEIPCPYCREKNMKIYELVNNCHK